MRLLISTTLLFQASCTLHKAQVGTSPGLREIKLSLLSRAEHMAGPRSGFVTFLDASMTQRIGRGGAHKVRSTLGLLTKSATTPRILDILYHDCDFYFLYSGLDNINEERILLLGPKLFKRV